MKSLKILFILAIILMLYSCGNQDRFAPACHLNAAGTDCVVP